MRGPNLRDYALTFHRLAFPQIHNEDLMYLLGRTRLDLTLHVPLRLYRLVVPQNHKDLYLPRYLDRTRLDLTIHKIQHVTSLRLDRLDFHLRHVPEAKPRKVKGTATRFIFYHGFVGKKS